MNIECNSHLPFPIDRLRTCALSVSSNRQADMATGTVKWFNETKGYGFIQPDNGGKDVFVRISAVERSGMSGLAEGMKITYDVEWIGRPARNRRRT